MAVGHKSKDGIIIKSSKGFNYYYGLNDDGLRPVLKEDSKKGQRVKTLKVFEPVEIANNQISVKIYPDGRILVEPSV
jgi:hypothetical protein